MVSLGLLIIRSVVGAVFVVHGYPKLFGGPGKTVSAETERVLGKGFADHMAHGGPANTAKMVGGLGIPGPRLMTGLLAVAELGGGLALILGWKTRLAALALCFSQFVAVEKVHGRHGLVADKGYEENALLIAATAGLALAGPGALALD
jgi:putative oxidoreductase